MNFEMSTATMDALKEYRELRMEFDSYFNDDEFTSTDDSLIYVALSKEIDNLKDLLLDKEILEEIKAKRRV